MIPPQTIEKIFSAAKIEEVVSDHVSLKRRGANLIGLCPFHSERTGSFTVSPTKGIFKCFGCGESGNAVGFVMKIENCTYVEALRILARKYHIEIEERELTPEEKQQQDDRESMFAVNEWSNQWFQKQLWETDEGRAVGLAYFHERGLQDTTIKKFGLGFSPDKKTALSDEARHAGYLDKYLTNNQETQIGTGVCMQKEDGRITDRFRDRVIFPIYTPSGKTVAFAGRILRKKYDATGKEIPMGKYVNSPGSVIYSKTNELYGLFQAKKAITQKDLCYLVEGQMDALSMYQAGIENVVCSGGTALTQAQVRLIKRFTSKITVLYDGDSAGIHAAIRGVDMFLQEGFTVKVVLLPDGEDPDSYAQSHNASEFIEYIEKNQKDFIRFKAQLSWEKAKDDPSKRSELTHELVQSIALIPDEITRYEYIRDCAAVIQTSDSLLTRAVAAQRREIKENADKQRVEKEKEKESADILPSQLTAATPVQRRSESKIDQNFLNIIQLIVKYGERPLYAFPNGSKISTGDYILNQLHTSGIEITNPLYKRICDEFEKNSHTDGFIAENYFKFNPDPEISALACDLVADRYQLSRIFSTVAISENVMQKVNEQSEAEMLHETVPLMLCELQLSILEQRVEQVRQQIKDASASGDDATAMHQLAQLNSLEQSRRELKAYLGHRTV